ncbi:MAG: hypothetical protein A2869_04205 [Candidatus Levybacteria bacterium RIFCSPHIGHO2_01_FULL_40_58]|nr:MAG: hypothetical protein A2869_04205 [Candidatus Levybacteria bacterium RIFCSPHIGHO2_01_FULL_40_58]
MNRYLFSASFQEGSVTPSFAALVFLSAENIGRLKSPSLRLIGITFVFLFDALIISIENSASEQYPSLTK